MPLIEELPTTTTVRASHGWTYVPDIGAPIPAVQLGSRKRARGNDGGTSSTARSIIAGSTHKLSAKQEKALQSRLDDLNKENFRDNVQIAIPRREAGVKGREGRKTTSNVRRILQYNRTFQHYLADEEAGVNVYGAGAGPSAGARTASVGGATSQQQKSAAERKKSTATTSETASTAAQKTGTRRTSSLRTSRTSAAAAKSEDAEMTDAQSPSSPPTATQSSPGQKQPSSRPSSPTTTQTTSSYDPSLDKDPLLRTRDIPKMPSARIMQALLAEPPLSYKAARAKPLEDLSVSEGAFTTRTGNNTLSAKPQRWFCAVCGYWGKVRCKYGCGERVCGLLECVKGHEGVCALAQTAY